MTKISKTEKKNKVGRKQQPPRVVHPLTINKDLNERVRAKIPIKILNNKLRQVFIDFDNSKESNFTIEQKKRIKEFLNNSINDL